MGISSRKKVYEMIIRTKNSKYRNLLKYYKIYFRLEEEKKKRLNLEKYFFDNNTTE